MRNRLNVFLLVGCALASFAPQPVRADNPTVVTEWSAKLSLRQSGPGTIIVNPPPQWAPPTNFAALSWDFTAGAPATLLCNTAKSYALGPRTFALGVTFIGSEFVQPSSTKAIAGVGGHLGYLFTPQFFGALGIDLATKESAKTGVLFSLTFGKKF